MDVPLVWRTTEKLAKVRAEHLLYTSDDVIHSHFEICYFHVETAKGFNAMHCGLLVLTGGQSLLSSSVMAGSPTGAKCVNQNQPRTKQ